MKNLKLIVLSLFFASLFFVSCDKDDDDDDLIEVNLTEALVKHLEQINFVNTYMPAMIDASDVQAANLTGDVYVIDTRSEADYNAGHIEGAVNVSAANVLSHIEDTDLSGYEKIVLACYTGQTAGFQTSLLRVLGYDNVYDLKWGMSSWHTDFAGRWQNSLGNAYAVDFTTDPADKNPEGKLPEITTSHTDAADILYERVQDVKDQWDNGKISAQEVFSNLDNYYIVNYWSEAQYNLGHIPGAVQYTPKSSMDLAADLKTLPTDKTIVIYCFTGQTSAQLAAYLRIIGYDAKSLLFGVNAMNFNMLEENSLVHFKDSYIMDYDYVTSK